MLSLTYTEPLLSVFLATGFIGVVAVRLPRRWRRLLVGVSLTGLLLVSSPAVEALLALAVEFPYRSVRRPERHAEAIVVLAGSGDPAYVGLPVSIPGPGSYARCRYAAWLYGNWRAVPIVVSGGTNRTDRPAVASLMAHVLRSEGVPPEKIVQEAESRNTYENALFTAGILHGRGIREVLLVVDADSMLRAELCFRKQNIGVVPAPMGHRAVPNFDLMPSWGAVRGNEITLHELLGLAWYKFRGWI